jgi:hypothetical protein
MPEKQKKHYDYLSSKSVNESESFFGIKSCSSLSKIICIPEQTPYDYMHLLLQGHDKWLLNQIFFKKDSPSYLTTLVVDVMNERLKTVQLPHTINRKPRKIDEVLKWKSSEIKIFCFYLAVPLFLDVMPSIYFCNFSIYIFATRMLYEPITELNVSLAKDLLDNYYLDLQKLYGEYAYDFTAHGLTHLADQVLKHGPLKTHSNFVFEAALGNIKNLLSGSKGYLDNISNKLSIMSELFDKKYLKSYTDTKKTGNICLKNPTHRRKLTVREMDFFRLDHREYFVLSATRFSINNEEYHCSSYNRKLTSNSYTVCFNHDSENMRHGEIFGCFQFENELFVEINVFRMLDLETKFPEFCSGYYYSKFCQLFHKFYTLVCTADIQTEIINARKIKHKCILIRDQQSENALITYLPYGYEHD